VVVNSRIYDRAPKKWVVIVSSAILALAVLGVGIASTLAVFVVMAMLLGIAQGFAVPASSAFLIDGTPRSQMGMAIGVYRTFGDAAAVLGPLAVGILIVAAGGQLAAGVLAGCILAILVVFARFAVDPDSRSSAVIREGRHDGI
jgi:MFS family permease